EVGKAFGRKRSVAACHGRKRRVEFARLIKQRRDTPKAGDLCPHGKRCQKLRPLQWFGLVGQHGETTVDAALPVICRSWDRPRRQTTQFPQRECQKPAGPHWWRQRWQQAERDDAGAYAYDNRRGGVVELLGGVGHSG